MSIVGDDMNVCNVFRSFGSYVRLQVKDSQNHRGTLNFLLCSFEICIMTARPHAKQKMM